MRTAIQVIKSPLFSPTINNPRSDELTLLEFQLSHLRKRAALLHAENDSLRIKLALAEHELVMHKALLRNAQQREMELRAMMCKET